MERQFSQFASSLLSNQIKQRALRNGGFLSIAKLKI